MDHEILQYSHFFFLEKKVCVDPMKNKLKNFTEYKAVLSGISEFDAFRFRDIYYLLFRIYNALLNGTEKRKEKSRFEKQVPATLAGIENTYEENMRKRERK